MLQSSFLLAWLNAVLLVSAPNLPRAQKNPLAGNAAAAVAGKTLFSQTCQGCHGANAKGGRGPNLAAGNFQHGNRDIDLFRTIRKGIPGTGMPAFAALPAKDVWRIITYLRSLNLGNAATWRPCQGILPLAKVFWGKGRCAQCHEVNARGSVVGPDLSAAGVHSAAYLQHAILDPNAPAFRRLRRQFAAMRVQTRNGQVITGIKRAQDNFTLILTDLNGKLRRFDRKDLADEQILQRSLRPGTYRQTLSSAEIENLIAYLKTLEARNLSKRIQVPVAGGLSYARLRHADAEPQNWLTYWGDYQGHHYSSLSQITPRNVQQLSAR